MGTGGTAIFSDDLASDIRDDYRDLIGDGHAGQDATDTLLEEYADSLHDQDEGPVFWLALAATQWKCGRLEERVRDRALEIIDSGTDLQRWEENPKELVKRRAVLEKLREQLLSPQPPPKKIPKRFRDTCDWEIGELIAYRLCSDRFIIFQVVGYHTDKGGTCPIVKVLKWVGESIPTAKELARIDYWDNPRDYPQDRRQDIGSGPHDKGIFSIFKSIFKRRPAVPAKRKLSAMLGRTKESEMPVDRIKRLGIKLPSTTEDTDGAFFFIWRFIDRQLEELLGVK